MALELSRAISCTAFSQLYAFFTLPLLAIFYRVRSVARGVFICLILQIKWPFESLMFLIAFHLPISFHGCPSDFTVVKCTFTQLDCNPSRSPPNPSMKVQISEFCNTNLSPTDLASAFYHASSICVKYFLILTGIIRLELVNDRQHYRTTFKILNGDRFRKLIKDTLVLMVCTQIPIFCQK